MLTPEEVWACAYAIFHVKVGKGSRVPKTISCRSIHDIHTCTHTINNIYAHTHTHRQNCKVQYYVSASPGFPRSWSTMVESCHRASTRCEFHTFTNHLNAWLGCKMSAVKQNLTQWFPIDLACRCGLNTNCVGGTSKYLVSPGLFHAS